MDVKITVVGVLSIILGMMLGITLAPKLGRPLTITTTIAYPPSTTTIIMNHTITNTTIMNYTTTITLTQAVNYTTTVTATITTTTTTTATVTTTVTTTTTATLTQPATVNMTEAIYNPAYFIKAFKNYTSILAPYYRLLGLVPIVQFACYATGFKLPNGTGSFIIVLVGNASSLVSINGFWPLPNGTEWSTWAWAVLGVNTTGALESAFYERVFGLPAYTIGNITIAGGVYGKGFTPLFPYNLPNGTYLAWLVNFNESSIIYPCILEVVNAESWSVLANYTFLGAQYWAWVRSMAYFGRPAPCFEPFEWTIGWQLARLNITMPIGSAWQYYCGPSGIWRNLRP